MAKEAKEQLVSYSKVKRPRPLNKHLEMSFSSERLP